MTTRLKRIWRDRWKEKTVVCIASGPSLTPQDCDLVFRAGLPTIVTNTTFRLAPWAHVLIGFDAKWWTTYLREIRETFRGECITCAAARLDGVTSLATEFWFRPFGNSGAAAVSLAIAANAQRVIMVGYDAQKAPDGRAHWHADHPAPLSNAKSIANWPNKFDRLANYASKQRVEVINASRASALKQFPRADLEAVLHPG